MRHIPPHNRRRVLAHLIIEDGRSKTEIAVAAGITPSAFGAILSGKVATPFPATREAIARALDVDVDHAFPEFANFGVTR